MSRSLERETPVAMERSAQLGLAALVSVVLALALAAFAFWPAHSWAPPARPGLSKPIVFDEFFNAPAPPSSGSVGPASSAP